MARNSTTSAGKSRFWGGFALGLLVGLALALAVTLGVTRNNPFVAAPTAHPSHRSSRQSSPPNR